MRKLDTIINVAVLIAAVYMGLTVGSHGRAIKILSQSYREQYSVDSALFDAIKYVDSLQWEHDSLLMRNLIHLNEKIEQIEK